MTELPTQLTPADDLGHDLGSDPRARESLLFTIVLPEHDLFTIIYMTRKARPEAVALAVAFAAETILEIHPDQAVEGDDLRDVRAGPLHVRHGAPLVGATVAYTGSRIQAAFDYTGVHEAFDFKRNRDGCVPAAATNRFEQSGLISGTLSIDDRDHRVDTTGHRDHSWGVRDYAAIHHYHWISGQAGPDLAFHAMRTWWKGQEYTNGYVWKDGVLASVESLRMRTEHDDDLLHNAVDLELTDGAGRTTTVTGRRFAGGMLPLGDVVLGEAGYRMQIDGHEGSGSHEQGWRPEYLEHMRKAAT